MPYQVFAAVILAAFLHATWNAMVRGFAGNGDKTVGMTSVILGEGLWGLPVLLLVPWPPVASYPYIAGSVALHTGYGLVLSAAYKSGELTQVYPIARGTGPLLVAAFSVLVLHEAIGPIGLAGIAVICAGIISLALNRQAAGMLPLRPTLFALATGCFIASYSIVDGLGGRIAGGASAYWSWIAVLDTIVYLTIMMAWRGPRQLSGKLAANWRVVLIGGFACYLAYWLVIWAFTQAPIAMVSALRETSIVFALLIGVVVLKEKLDVRKLVSTFVTLSGAMLIRIGR